MQQEMTQQSDRWAVELPFGMPRDTHLLPPHSQELLRAARSGRLYKRPAPVEEEEAEAEADPVKGEKKEWDTSNNEGFMVKMWRQVPRNAETPITSHLAKRHKNTVTLASKAAATQLAGPTVIRATVRRIDAAGNPYEQTVTLTEGQQVDGEIISTTVVPAPSANQGELAPQQATPVRRRPPPPKRKSKGIGRGRRKGRLPLPLPATRSSQPSAAAGGSLPVRAEGVAADVSLHVILTTGERNRMLTTGHEQGIKIEDTEDSGNQDSEMADMSGLPSEEEEAGDGDEGDEGEEEGGEDEAGETPDVGSPNGDTQGLETEDSEMSEAIQPSSVEEADDVRPAPSEGEEVTIPKARSHPPSLSNLPPHLASPKGSPLKNVMIQSPTEPAPHSASGYLDVRSRTMATALSSGTTTTVSQTLVAETTVQGVSDGAGAGQTAAESTTTTEATSTTAAAVAAAATSGPTEQISEPSNPLSAAAQVEPPPPTKEEKAEEDLQPPDSPALLPTAVAEDEDDGSLNLLGSLERELDRQEEGLSSSRSRSRSGEGADEEGNGTGKGAATSTDEGGGGEGDDGVAGDAAKGGLADVEVQMDEDKNNQDGDKNKEGRDSGTEQAKGEEGAGLSSA
jgi:hypothetical protein